MVYAFFQYNNEDNKNYTLALFYCIALSSATSSILIFYIFRLYLTFKETSFGISKKTLKSLLYVAISSGIITLIGMFIRLVSLFDNAGIGWTLFTASWTVCIFEYILLAILFSKKLIKLVTMQKSDTKAKINQLKRYYRMHSQNNISTTFDDNNFNNNDDQNENINYNTAHVKRDKSRNVNSKQNVNNKKNNNSKNRPDKKKKKTKKTANGNDADDGGDMPGARPNFKKAFSMSQSSVNINGNQLSLVSNNSKEKAPQTMMIRVVTPEASGVDTVEEDNSIGNNNTDNNNNNNNGNSANKKDRGDADYIGDTGADADGNLSPRAANKLFQSALVAVLFQSGLWLSFMFAEKQCCLCCSCCHRCTEFLCVKLVVKREGIRVEDAIEASIGGSINVNRNGNGDGVAIPVGGLSPVSVASTNDNSKGNSSYPNLEDSDNSGSAFEICKLLLFVQSFNFNTST